jgi:hypothetical protein
VKNSASSEANYINLDKSSSYVIGSDVKVSADNVYIVVNNKQIPYAISLTGKLSDNDSFDVSIEKNSYHFWENYNKTVNSSLWGKTVNGFPITLSDALQVSGQSIDKDIPLAFSFKVTTKNTNFKPVGNADMSSVYYDSKCKQIGGTCKIYFYDRPPGENPVITLNFDNGYQNVLVPVKVTYWIPSTAFITNNNNKHECSYLYYKGTETTNYCLWEVKGVNADDFEVNFMYNDGSDNLRPMSKSDLEMYYGTSDLYTITRDGDNVYWNFEYDPKIWGEKVGAKQGKSNYGFLMQAELRPTRTYFGHSFTGTLLADVKYVKYTGKPICKSDQVFSDTTFVCESKAEEEKEKEEKEEKKWSLYKKISVKKSKYTITLKNTHLKNQNVKIKTSKKSYTLKFNNKGVLKITKAKLKKLKKANKKKKGNILNVKILKQSVFTSKTKLETLKSFKFKFKF